MHKKKNKGPRVDSCGTSYSLGCDFDVWPSREAKWDHLRKISITIYAVSRISYVPAWLVEFKKLTVSNAFFRSKKKIPVYNLSLMLSNALVMLSNMA